MGNKQSIQTIKQYQKWKPTSNITPGNVDIYVVYNEDNKQINTSFLLVDGSIDSTSDRQTSGVYKEFDNTWTYCQKCNMNYPMAGSFTTEKGITYKYDYEHCCLCSVVYDVLTENHCHECKRIYKGEFHQCS